MQAKLVGATLCFSRLWLQWVALTEVKTRDPSEEPLGLEGWWQWETESLHITKTVRRVRHDFPWLPEAIKFKWSVNKVKPKGLKKVKNCQFNIGNRADAFRQRQALKLSVRIRSHRKSTPMAMSGFFSLWLSTEIHFAQAWAFLASLTDVHWHRDANTNFWVSRPRCRRQWLLASWKGL